MPANEKGERKKREPKQKPKAIEEHPQPENIVHKSLTELKQSGLLQISHIAETVEDGLKRRNDDTAENTLVVKTMTEGERAIFPHNFVRITLEGNSPDNLHFQLKLHPDSFLDMGPQQIASYLLPYFSIMADFVPAVRAPSVDTAYTHTTYADTHYSSHLRAYTVQLDYQERVNDKFTAKTRRQNQVFPHVNEDREKLPERLHQLIFQPFENGMARADFGIHEFLLIANPDFPDNVRKRFQAGLPIIDLPGLTGNAAKQEEFMAQLYLAAAILRPNFPLPDLSYAEAISEISVQDFLPLTQEGDNPDKLQAFLKNPHPLRLFMYARALLFQQVIEDTFDVLAATVIAENVVSGIPKHLDPKLLRFPAIIAFANLITDLMQRRGANVQQLG